MFRYSAEYYNPTTNEVPNAILGNRAVMVEQSTKAGYLDTFADDAYPAQLPALGARFQRAAVVEDYPREENPVTLRRAALEAIAQARERTGRE